MNLLVDLRDLATRSNENAEFQAALVELRDYHAAKPSLLKRFLDAGCSQRFSRRGSRCSRQTREQTITIHGTLRGGTFYALAHSIFASTTTPGFSAPAMKRLQASIPARLLLSDQHYVTDTSQICCPTSTRGRIVHEALTLASLFLPERIIRKWSTEFRRGNSQAHVLAANSEELDSPSFSAVSSLE